MPETQGATSLRAVIGVGASAGGLDALRRFFSAPVESLEDLAFIVVQHLDPDHASHMVSLLERVTPLPVVTVEEAQAIEAGRVYVMPPGRIVRVRDGHLRLAPPPSPHGPWAAVDTLFRSLAVEYGERAVGVVLSGSGSDGAGGVRAIAAAGGTCLAQDPKTAEHDSMPARAIETGVLHAVRPAEQLLEAIVAAIKHPEPGGIEDDDAWHELLALVKARQGRDFNYYKPNTIVRRVGRRMGMLGIDSIAEYTRRVEHDEIELDGLCRDMLIGVTSFFRDESVFEYFRAHVAPAVVKAVGERSEIRSWIAGCSTGEEAYTVAMLLLEEIERTGSTARPTLFASDIDEGALAYGRAGVYSAAVTDDFPGDLRAKYFVRRDTGGYQVSRRLRDAVTFAEHDLLADPPFSKLDLVTCRNVLIYLKPEVQESILSIFHYALRPEGFLMLGGSESLRRQATLFKVASREHRVFQRVGDQAGTLPRLPVERMTRMVKPGPERRGAPKATSFAEAVQRWTNERFAPATIVVNRNHEVVHFSGKAHRFVAIPEGSPTHDLFTMLGSAAASRVRAMLGRVMRSGQGEAPRSVMLRRSADGVGGPVEAMVGVLPFSEGEQAADLFVVTFQEIGPHAAEHVADLEESAVIAHLEHELKTTREDLQSTIEETEASAEELKASNEEAMSINEELQSSNEELETSKEELHSLNEELSTVNAQLREKLNEVEGVNNDISNLFTSTALGVLFLDEQLRIKRFTPELTDLFRVAPSDIDRPVGDIVRRFDAPSFEADVRRVLERLARTESTVRLDDGRVFLETMVPYRTRENRIEGVVITYADVTTLNTTIASLERSQLQQSLLSQLSVQAMEADDLQEVLDAACRFAKRALGADLAKVLRLTEPGGPLLLVAGTGWKPGLVGLAVVSADPDSQAGYTLESDEPVVVFNAAEEHRFAPPSLLVEHGVVSGIASAIVVDGVRWGIIGIDSRHERNFSDEDTDFILSVAAVIGQTIRQFQTTGELRRNAERLEFSLDASAVGAWEYRPADGVVVPSEQQCRLFGLAPETEFPGDEFWSRVHPEDRERVDRLISAGIADRREFKDDFRIVLPSGEIRWLHGAGAVVDADGNAIVYGVNFDITDRVNERRRLESAQAELETEVQKRGNLAEERLKQIRRMTHEMVIAESIERRRLAEELHDNLGQLLNLALMRIAAARGGSDPERLDELRDIVRRAADTARSITGQLSPRVLDELGLGPALVWIAEEIERVYDVRVSVHEEAQPMEIARSHAYIVFRAVRELLINVARHAGVKKAEMRMQRGALGFRVEISDGGLGFDVEKVFAGQRPGYGLLGMRERISHIEGVVEIESCPGAGCTVAIEIPDPTPEQEADHDGSDQ